MRIIEIDGTNWETVLDFYRALFDALGAPEWHGTSIDALLDSMIWGGINAVEPPYTVRVRGTSNLPNKIRDEIEVLKKYLGIHREEFLKRNGHAVDVYVETDS
jgi:RNAse (barnase) inhibitor barstar